MTNSDLYVIDTHALLWFFTADRRLSERAKELLLLVETGFCEGVIPMIVMAEAISVIEKGRSPLTVSQLLSRVQRERRFRVAAFDMEVLEEMLRLPTTLELHDRAIAATARVLGGQVITRDPAIAAAVATAW